MTVNDVDSSPDILMKKRAGMRKNGRPFYSRQDGAFHH